MAISLNDHESRIATLENNKSSVEYGGDGVKGYVKINGIQLCFGYSNDKTEIFYKAFPNKCWQVVQTFSETTLARDNSDSCITDLTNSGFTRYSLYWHRYIAIGYLVSNRIKSMLGVI